MGNNMSGSVSVPKRLRLDALHPVGMAAATPMFVGS